MAETVQRAHPTPRTYWAIAAFLAVVTAIEIAVPSIEALKPVKVPLLWLLGAALFTGLDENPDGAGDDSRLTPADLARPLIEDAEFRGYIAARGLLIATALAPPFLVMLSCCGTTASSYFASTTTTTRSRSP